MPRFFTARLISQTADTATVEVGFADSAHNTEIVPAAIAAVASLNLRGGCGIHFNGPASLPAAMALGHAVAHLYGYVACYDPKLQGYIVAISHHPDFQAGQLIASPDPK